MRRIIYDIRKSQGWGIHHVRVAPFRAAVRLYKNVSLVFCEMHLPCFSFSIVTTGDVGGVILEEEDYV